MDQNIIHTLHNQKQKQYPINPTLLFLMVQLQYQKTNKMLQGRSL